MDKVVPDGCHVLVDPDVEPQDGSVAIVELEDHRAVMRRCFRGATTLLLRADSHAEYEDIVMTGDEPVRAVGTVVWFQSAEEMR